MTQTLWTEQDIIKATQGFFANDSIRPEMPITGVSIDSRTLVTGDIFIALVGDNFDGHDYVQSAHADGASIAIVSTPVDCPCPQIVVPDTEQAMINLGIYRRHQVTAKIIAITGSVGKTSTKEGLHHILSQQGKTHANLGNLNNHLGLPLSMARMPLDTQFGIFELGMNHAGEIEYLTKMLRPDVACITMIAPAHIEFFDSLAGIAYAKAEIFAGLPTGATVVFPNDCEHADILLNEAQRHKLLPIQCGNNAQADIQLLSHSQTKTGSQVSILLEGRTLEYSIGALGHSWVQNSLIILGMVAAVGGNVVTGAQSLADLKSPTGRGEILSLSNHDKSITVIDDSYNASVISMQNAIDILSSIDAKRHVAILGEMLELGNQSQQSHTQIGKYIMESIVDSVYTVGDGAKPIDTVLSQSKIPHQHYNTADDLQDPLIELINDGDVILIKGSLGSNVHSLATHLKQQFQ